MRSRLPIVLRTNPTTKPWRQRIWINNFAAVPATDHTVLLLHSARSPKLILRVYKATAAADNGHHSWPHFTFTGDRQGTITHLPKPRRSHRITATPGCGSDFISTPLCVPIHHSDGLGNSHGADIDVITVVSIGNDTPEIHFCPHTTVGNSNELPQRDISALGLLP